MLTKIAGNSVLSSTTLGTGVTSSSLTTVGTLTSGTWNATLITSQYGGTGFNNSAAAQYALPYYSATGVLGGTLAVGTTGQCLVGNTTAAPTWGTCGGFVSSGGTIIQSNITQDLLLGGVSTSSATFHVYGTTLAGTSPVTSIAANTSYAALVVDNSGKGDLFTASSSGLSRFVITQSGNVGIGTNIPSATLDFGAQVTGTGIRFSNISGIFGTAIDFSGTNGVGVYSGTGINMPVMQTTTGTSINMSGNETGQPVNFPGNYFNINPILQLGQGAGPLTDSGHFVNLTRTDSVNVDSTYNITGNMLSIYSNCTATNNGVCADTSSLI